MATAKTLILVLGDQLSPRVAALRHGDPATDVVLMAELAVEATYVPHHKKKIAFLFSAMRHFAEELRGRGWTVDYHCLQAGGFGDAVAHAIATHKPSSIVTTEPGEWRVREEIERWSERFALPVYILYDDRFICSRREFTAWALGRKQLRMEYFYREMRKKTGLLMDGDAPAGGMWNLDKENRKPASGRLLMPQPLRVAPDAVTQDVLALVAQRFPDHFGDLTPF